MDADKTLEYAKPLIQGRNRVVTLQRSAEARNRAVEHARLVVHRVGAAIEDQRLGATPAQAFEIATGVELLDMMRLGGASSSAIRTAGLGRLWATATLELLCSVRLTGDGQRLGSQPVNDLKPPSRGDPAHLVSRDEIAVGEPPWCASPVKEVDCLSCVWT
jgi:hypothetical protein